jgi:50S ribosomal protein L16 3-hydroxylase
MLRRFAFLPYARLDDVMVSYAAPGGGVGPHFDSYDVFLLQGFGAAAGATARSAISRCVAGCP